MKRLLFFLTAIFGLNYLLVTTNKSQAVEKQAGAKSLAEQHMLDAKAICLAKMQQIVKDADKSLDDRTSAVEKAIDEIVQTAIKSKELKSASSINAYLDTITSELVNFLQILEADAHKFKTLINTQRDSSIDAIKALATSNPNDMNSASAYADALTDSALDLGNKIDTKLAAKSAEITKLQTDATQKIHAARVSANNAQSTPVLERRDSSSDIVATNPNEIDSDDIADDEDPFEQFLKKHWDALVNKNDATTQIYGKFKVAAKAMAGYYATLTAMKYKLIDQSGVNRFMQTRDGKIAKRLLILPFLPDNVEGIMGELKQDNFMHHINDIWRRNSGMTRALREYVKQALNIDDDQYRELELKSNGSLIELCKNYQQAFDQAFPDQNRNISGDEISRFKKSFKEAYHLGDGGRFNKFELSDFYNKYAGKLLPAAKESGVKESASKEVMLDSSKSGIGQFTKEELDRTYNSDEAAITEAALGGQPISSLVRARMQAREALKEKEHSAGKTTNTPVVQVNPVKQQDQTAQAPKSPAVQTTGQVAPQPSLGQSFKQVVQQVQAKGSSTGQAAVVIGKNKEGEPTYNGWTKKMLLFYKPVDDIAIKRGTNITDYMRERVAARDYLSSQSNAA